MPGKRRNSWLWWVVPLVVLVGVPVVIPATREWYFTIGLILFTVIVFMVVTGGGD